MLGKCIKDIAVFLVFLIKWILVYSAILDMLDA